jgi:Uma2 family endonuclease
MAPGLETRLVTAGELLRFADDGYRYELVRGGVRRMNPSGARHGVLAARVAELLGAHVRPQGLGEVMGAETGFVLASDPDTVRAPDAAFVTRERIKRTGLTEGFFPGAPDLAVEVISPNDSYTEVEEKALAWLAAGSRMVLVVDPRRRSVTVYRSPADIRVLAGEEAIDGDDVVPGWHASLAELFD